MNWSSKAESRAYFSNLWRTEGAFRAGLQQQGLNKILKEFLKSRRGYWAAFKALMDEPHLEEVVSEMNRIDWVFPRLKAYSPELELYKTNFFEKSSLGFLEPVREKSELIPIENVSGVLVPGLAFNSLGVRLGRGKGYYDRTLAGYRGLKVGVCFSGQFWSGELPFENHDVKMDYVVTENKIWTTHSP